MTKKKVAVGKKKPNPVTIDTLSKLINAVCYLWRHDPSQPSVTLSLLKDGQYYGSVIRYHKAYGENKQIVFTTRAKTIGEVLRELGRQLLAHRDVMDQLKEAIR